METIYPIYVKSVWTKNRIDMHKVVSIHRNQQLILALTHVLFISFSFSLLIFDVAEEKSESFDSLNYSASELGLFVDC